MTLKNDLMKLVDVFTHTLCQEIARAIQEQPIPKLVVQSRLPRLPRPQRPLKQLKKLPDAKRQPKLIPLGEKHALLLPDGRTYVRSRRREIILVARRLGYPTE
jgi:hypothetical protein